MLHQNPVDVGTKTSSFDTAFPNPSITTIKETSPSFKELMMAEHTVTHASEYMAGIVDESDSDFTNHKLRPPSKSAIKLASETRSEIERTLADFGVEARTDIRMLKNA